VFTRQTRVKSQHTLNLQVCNMANEVQWHSQRVAACILVLLYGNRQKRNRKGWNIIKVWRKPYFSRNLTHCSVQHARPRASFASFLRRYTLQTKHPGHRSGQFWTSLMNWKGAHSSSRRSAILWSVMQIRWTECMFWLVNSHQHTFANRSHFKYEFANTKKLVKKLARIETNSICRQ